MKRAALAALAAFLAVPLLAAGQGLGAPAAPAAPPAPTGKTLRVVEKITGTTTIDLGDEGIGPGDRLAFTSQVSRRDGRRIGSGAGDCVLYAGDSAETARYYCTEAFALARGQIFASGLVDPDRETSSWAITGGTGRFRGASGQLDVRETGPDTFADVFRFAD